MITAADFLATLDDAALSRKGQAILLNYMSDILDKINETNAPPGTLKMRPNEDGGVILYTATYTVIFSVHGVRSTERWSSKKHFFCRDNDKPAFVSYHSNGNKASEGWFLNGVKHRAKNEPADIQYDPSGRVISRTKFWNGLPA